ncbi:hypothetical protein [Sulfurimonas sp.]|uniref:hypothetical protein n=1 Tax=Sulfurimonas sp. TaxID=2022749 RepID=UPI0019ECEC9C|nr:hypothetical protein [Sulfurimonas sp.]MBE0515386.1 hypothetical protein [Sulfurimonas sp.]
MFKKILLAVFIFYALFGFILFPLIVKSQIENIAAQETSSKLSVDDVCFNPILRCKSEACCLRHWMKRRLHR